MQLSTVLQSVFRLSYLTFLELNIFLNVLAVSLEFGIFTFLPALTEHDCTPLEREILALPVRKGGPGVTNPCQEAELEYAASTKVTAPLVEQIQAQTHELPDDSRIQKLKQMVRKEKNDALNENTRSHQ